MINHMAKAEANGPKSLREITIGNEVMLKTMIVQQHWDNNWLMTVRF